MKNIFKYKKNSKFRGAIKNNNRKVFIKDLKKTKFKKRKNKKFLRFLQYFDIKVDRKNIIYVYIVGLIAIASIVSLIIFGPYFKIDTINIIRQDNLSDINIAYKALDKVRGSHIMFSDKIEIEKNIKSYQENIKNVSITRKLPNKLDININSYQPIFNTILNNKGYIVTENGSFIPSKENPELKKLIIISKKQSVSIPDYKRIIDQEHMTKIRDIYKKIKTNIIRIQILDMTYYPQERELMVRIEGGTKLLFDLEKVIEPQIKRLAIFDTENKKIDIPEIIYIDLRINNRVFYCTTETEYQCIINLKNIYPENT